MENEGENKNNTMEYTEMYEFQLRASTSLQ